MKKFEQLCAQWRLLESYGDIQHETVKALDVAQDAEDEKLMAQICRHVIGEEAPNHLYSPDFQIACLHWLTEDCIERLNLRKTEKAKKKVCQELSHCLWAYKWFIADLPLMPDMSKEHIEFYNEVMREYYERGELGTAMLHKCLMLQAMNMGDIERAKIYHQAWHQSEKDDFSDCEACELNDEIHYRHFIGQYKQTVQLAQPILDGSMSCGEVPHNTYYPIIDSLIESDQWTEAAAQMHKAVQLIESAGEDFIHLLPRLIQLQIKLGQYDTAQSLSEKYHEAIGRRSQNHPIITLHYLSAMAYFKENIFVSAKELAQDLSQMYDKRNGNAYYSKRLQQLLNAQQMTLQ